MRRQLLDMTTIAEFAPPGRSRCRNRDPVSATGRKRPGTPPSLPYRYAGFLSAILAEWAAPAQMHPYSLFCDAYGCVQVHFNVAFCISEIANQEFSQNRLDEISAFW